MKKNYLLALIYIFSFLNTGIISANAQNNDILDVYLLAGQSNAAGYSIVSGLDNKYKTSYSDILYCHNVNGSIINLTNVKSGLGKTMDFFGPELGMAEILSSSYKHGKKAAIIKHAFGGTYLNDNITHNNSLLYGNWYPPSLRANGINNINITGKLYDSFLITIKKGLQALAENGYKVSIKGIVWMQGEADSATLNEATNYASVLNAFIKDIRIDLSKLTGQDFSYLPFIIGEIAPTFPTPYCTQLRESQSIVCKGLINGGSNNTIFIPTSNYKLPGTDPYHFSMPDMISLGKDFGQALINIKDKFYVSSICNKGGSVNLNNTYVDIGSSITFSATPLRGYKVKKTLFNGKEILLDSQNNYIVENVVDNLEFITEFASLPSYNLNVNINEGGKISRFPSGIKYYENEQIQITVMPDYGYVLKNISLNGKELLKSDDRFIFSITADSILNVNFEKIEIPSSESIENIKNPAKGCNGSAKISVIMSACLSFLILKKIR